jgi:hypothetical protein
MGQLLIFLLYQSHGGTIMSLKVTISKLVNMAVEVIGALISFLPLLLKLGLQFCKVMLDLLVLKLYFSGLLD